jgi:hypothetical protein
MSMSHQRGRVDNGISRGTNDVADAELGDWHATPGILLSVADEVPAIRRKY